MDFKTLKTGDKLRCKKTLSFCGSGIFKGQIYEVSHRVTNPHEILYLWDDDDFKFNNPQGTWDIWSQDDLDEYFEDIT